MQRNCIKNPTPQIKNAKELHKESYPGNKEMQMVCIKNPTPKIKDAKDLHKELYPGNKKFKVFAQSILPQK